MIPETTTPTRQAVLLVVPAQRAEWGVHADSIQSILTGRDWHGEVLNVNAIFDEVPEPAPGQRRVLLIRTPHGEVALLAAGRLSLRSVDPAQILPIPEIMVRGRRTRALGSLVVSDGGRPLFILDAAHLRLLGPQETVAPELK